MLRVLIVEDTPNMRYRLKHRLGRLLPQAEVLTSGTSTEALQILRQHPIALAIVDLMLPKGSRHERPRLETGLSLLTWIKRMPKPPYVIAVSSVSAAEEAVRQLGPAFVPKGEKSFWLGLDQELTGFLQHIGS